jgi:hypothetical protein
VRRVDLERRTGEGGTAVSFEESDRRYEDKDRSDQMAGTERGGGIRRTLTVSERFSSFSILGADKDSVKGEDKSSSGIDTVLDGEGKRDGGEGTEQVDPDKVDWRNEGGEDGLTAGGDKVGQRRCLTQSLQ